MPKIKANGINICYDIHGKGRPLVLVGGLTMNRFGWMSILPELAKHLKNSFLKGRRFFYR